MAEREMGGGLQGVAMRLGGALEILEFIKRRAKIAPGRGAGRIELGRAAIHRQRLLHLPRLAQHLAEIGMKQGVLWGVTHSKLEEIDSFGQAAALMGDQAEQVFGLGQMAPRFQNAAMNEFDRTHIQTARWLSYNQQIRLGVDFTRQHHFL